MAVEKQCRAVCALCRVDARTVYAMRQIVGELQLALSLHDPGLHGAAVKCVRNCPSDVGQRLCSNCLDPGVCLRVRKWERVKKCGCCRGVAEKGQQSWVVDFAWQAQIESRARESHATRQTPHVNTRYNHAIHSRDYSNAHHKMLNSARVHVKEKWRTSLHSAFIRPPACPT